MQPRGRRPREAGRLPGGWGDPALLRGPVDGGPRPRRPRSAPPARAARPGWPPWWPTPGSTRGTSTSSSGPWPRPTPTGSAPCPRRWRRPPPHVSAYALTVEPGTPLAGDPGRHPDDDVQARRYEQAEAVLSAAGYRWEEISNWAWPATAAGTTASTGARATTWGWGRPPTPTGTGGGGGTSVPRTATSARARPGARRWPARRCSPGPSGSSSGWPSRCAPRGRSRRRLPDTPELAGLVERAEDRCVLTVRGASWPTRSPRTWRWPRTRPTVLRP